MANNECGDNPHDDCMDHRNNFITTIMRIARSTSASDIITTVMMTVRMTAIMAAITTIIIIPDLLLTAGTTTVVIAAIYAIYLRASS